jgi:hypothetical protein
MINESDSTRIVTVGLFGGLSTDLQILASAVSLASERVGLHFGARRLIMASRLAPSGEIRRRWAQ